MSDALGFGVSGLSGGNQAIPSCAGAVGLPVDLGFCGCGISLALAKTSSDAMHLGCRVCG